jgi:RNA polymerase sigma-70 factor, ECF subfamily
MNKTERIDIQALQAGDRNEFARMVEEHSTKIYNLLLRMLRNPQEAEDVMQETFMNAFRSIASFQGRSQLSTWLYRIATNQALMRLRKRKPILVSVDEPIESSEGDLIPRELTDWCCLPEEEFMSSEVQEQLEEEIDKLSPALKAIFVLRDVQGFSTRESAEMLDISESAVKTRLLRARLQLRESLSGYFVDRVKVTQNE